MLAQRIDGGEVRRGDVVVFTDKTWGNAPMVKRVVAVGGDTVACCTDGKLTVNGKQIDEPYLPKGSRPSSRTSRPMTVPKGRLFLLGDERSGSLDSTRPPHGRRQRHRAARRGDGPAWTPSSGP